MTVDYGRQYDFATYSKPEGCGSSAPSKFCKWDYDPYLGWMKKRERCYKAHREELASGTGCYMRPHNRARYAGRVLTRAGVARVAVGTPMYIPSRAAKSTIVNNQFLDVRKNEEETLRVCSRIERTSDLVDDGARRRRKTTLFKVRQAEERRREYARRAAEVSTDSSDYEWLEAFGRPAMRICGSVSVPVEYNPAKGLNCVYAAVAYAVTGRRV